MTTIAQKRVEQSSPPTWHTLQRETVLQRLQVTQDGLSDQQVTERQQEYGRNVLPVKPPPTLVELFLHQFFSPLIYILLAAGLVSLLLGDFKDAIFIFVVVLLNAGIGTYQEWKAEKSAAALQSLLKIHARVRRNGIEQQIVAEELVPGDLVLLESGNRIPADLRLLQVNNLTIDESFLTGESVAVAKQTEPLTAELPLGERVNLAFAGSTVTTGRGSGVVVNIGSRTEVGQIAATVTAADLTKPPLVVKMEKFARQTSVIILGACLLLAIVAIAQGIPYDEVFFLAVALAVSAIPEGLPVAITVVLSIATSRMAKRKVIVRRLTAVEGLGSCTFIASDKTGTLTVNQQTAKTIALPGGQRFLVSGEGYNGDGEISDEGGQPVADAARTHLESLVKAAILCNEAQLTQQNGNWTQHGDAVDVALLALGYKADLPPAQVRQAVTVSGEIPYESERGFAATFYRDESYRDESAGDETHTDKTTTQVAVKGALERVLPHCTTMLTAQGVAPLQTAALEQAALALAAEGYRVLLIATGTMATAVLPNGLEEDTLPPLTVLGLVGFIDPLRPEAQEAVTRCRAAGIEVAMITGDHPATALAIARDLGLVDGEATVVTGSQLAAIGSSEVPEFLETVKRARVFARVAPLQKLHIVDALIKLGHFVAVTGDGVNDAPALRQANIGVAMGSGTDVAKDTASLIVTDDNFASIEAGVEEGRFAYDNVRKVTYLLISTGAAEVLLFTLAIVAGLPLPLFAVQLLWLNLVTNGIQDVALAFEAGEPGAMQRSPRRPTEGIFDRLMIQQTVVSGLTIGLIAFAVWYLLLDWGWEEATARNMLLLLVVLFQNFHVFNCRSERTSAFRVPLRNNQPLMIGVAAALALHLLAMQLPFMQTLLRTAPVSPLEFITLAFIASTVLVVMELFKWRK